MSQRTVTPRMAELCADFLLDLPVLPSMPVAVCDALRKYDLATDLGASLESIEYAKRMLAASIQNWLWSYDGASCVDLLGPGLAISEGSDQ